MTLRWYARDHQKALDGMLALSLEERGAYNTILDLIYGRSGPVPDDDRWLAGWMGCSVKKWRLLRAALLVKNKLYACELNDGQAALMNDRARQELDSSASRQRLAAESGARGGRKAAETKTNTSKNNDPSRGTLEGSLKLLTETDTGTESPITSNDVIAPQKPKAKKPRSRICPADWQPSAGDLAVGTDEGFTAGEIERELAKFRDHEFRDPHSEWSPTFRKWLRTAAERRPRPAHAPASRPDTRRAAFVERLGDIDSAMEAAFEQPRRKH